MMSPLKYLKQELQFDSKEWMKLSQEDKSELKQWAREEMKVLGIEFV